MDPYYHVITETQRDTGADYLQLQAGEVAWFPRPKVGWGRMVLLGLFGWVVFGVLVLAVVGFKAGVWK